MADNFTLNSSSSSFELIHFTLLCPVDSYIYSISFDEAASRGAVTNEALCLVFRILIPTLLAIHATCNAVLSVLYFRISAKVTKFNTAHQKNKVQYISSGSRHHHKQRLSSGGIRGYSLLVRATWFYTFSVSAIFGYPVSYYPGYPGTTGTIALLFAIGSTCVHLQSFMTVVSAVNLHSALLSSTVRVTKIVRNAQNPTFVIIILIVTSSSAIVSRVAYDSNLAYLISIRITLVMGIASGLSAVGTVYLLRKAIVGKVENFLDEMRKKDAPGIRQSSITSMSERTEHTEVDTNDNNVAKNASSKYRKRKEDRWKQQKRSQRKLQQLFLSEVVFSLFGITFYTISLTFTFHSVEWLAASLSCLYLVAFLAHCIFSYIDAWKIHRKYKEHRRVAGTPRSDKSKQASNVQPSNTRASTMQASTRQTSTIQD